MRYYGPIYPSLAAVQEYIAERQGDYARRDAIRWGITLKDDDTLIGSCGFHHFDEGYHRAETGYILNRAYWGQGIMAEALAAILTYGFSEMGLHRIEAIIDIANDARKACCSNWASSMRATCASATSSVAASRTNTTLACCATSGDLHIGSRDAA